MSIKGYNFYGERPIMARLYRRKKLGDNLSIGELTKDVLSGLWVDELVRDNDIADLFDTSTEAIYNLRQQYGITHEKCVREYMSKAYDILGDIGASIMQVA